MSLCAEEKIGEPRTRGQAVDTATTLLHEVTEGSLYSIMVLMGLWGMGSTFALYKAVGFIIQIQHERLQDAREMVDLQRETRDVLKEVERNVYIQAGASHAIP